MMCKEKAIVVYFCLLFLSMLGCNGDLITPSARYQEVMGSNLPEDEIRNFQILSRDDTLFVNEYFTYNAELTYFEQLAENEQVSIYRLSECDKNKSFATWTDAVIVQDNKICFTGQRDNYIMYIIYDPEMEMVWHFVEAIWRD